MRGLFLLHILIFHYCFPSPNPHRCIVESFNPKSEPHHGSQLDAEGRLEAAEELPLSCLLQRRFAIRGGGVRIGCDGVGQRGRRRVRFVRSLTSPLACFENRDASDWLSCLLVALLFLVKILAWYLAIILGALLSGDYLNLLSLRTNGSVVDLWHGIVCDRGCIRSGKSFSRFEPKCRLKTRSCLDVVWPTNCYSQSGSCSEWLMSVRDEAWLSNRQRRGPGNGGNINIQEPFHHLHHKRHGWLICLILNAPTRQP